MPTPLPGRSAPLVVPTAGGSASADALALARRLAPALGAEVRGVHVAAPLPQITGAELAVVHAASPAEGIAAFARDADAALVVLGRCGERPGPFGALVGELLHTAPCDVLLVPHRAGAAGPEGLPARLLAPVDVSDASRPLVAFALRLARALGAPTLDVVHVVEPLPYPVRWIDEVMLDLVPEIVRRAGDAVRGLVADVVREVRAADGGEAAWPETAVYVERGKAAPTIARVAETLGSDLLVLGPHAERPLADRLLGSVAEGVARRAAGPVLVARRSAAPTPASEPLDRHSYLRRAAAAA